MPAMILVEVIGSSKMVKSVKGLVLEESTECVSYMAT